MGGHFRLIRLAAVGLCAVAAACGSGDSRGDGPGSDDDADTDSETGTDADTDSGNGTDNDTDSETDTESDTGTDSVEEGSCDWWDSSSDLTWRVPTAGIMSYAAATAHCTGLVACGHDDWRIPTVGESRTLVRGCDDIATGGVCGVTDDCLEDGCWTWACGLTSCGEGAGPGPGGCFWPAEIQGPCDYSFHTASALPEVPANTYLIDYYYGVIMDGTSTYDNLVRCVRTGS